MRYCLIPNSLPGEIWGKVDGLDDYEVSNFGRVKDLTKSDDMIMALVNISVGTHGYPVCGLRTKNGRKMFFVHRLVALAHLPKKEGKPIINHKDEDKNNPSLDNLEWCTYKYNSNYGSGPLKRGEAIRRAYEKKREAAEKLAVAIDKQIDQWLLEDEEADW